MTQPRACEDEREIGQRDGKSGPSSRAGRSRRVSGARSSRRRASELWLFVRNQIAVAMVVLLGAISIVQKEFNCLKISSIEVPAAVWNGSRVTFVCNHELGPDEQLYSVKWYKNYVEFYRFQPQALDQAKTPLEGLDRLGGTSLNSNYPTAEARHEFELEGINLDLHKSNATHVHLRQVKLSSEATYKCEVSADSPTFATVSSERQMKVYVLPKQKLALLDNERQAARAQSGESSSAARPTASSRQLVYQLNDSINFTCIAGPSRPAVQLTWQLNDEPLALFNGTSVGGPLVREELKSISGELTEARSTLTLTWQAAHLKLLRRQLAGASQSRGSPAGQPQLGLVQALPVKLSCLARLAVEFASETSVLVSDGARASASRQQQPIASSLVSQNESEIDGQLVDGRRLTPSDGQSVLSSAAYRWPPPSGHHALPFAPSLTPTSGAGSEIWIAPSHNLPQTDATPQSRHHAHKLHSNVVWTQRQLKAQSEHIDSLVRRAHSNELEAPHIEAKSIGQHATPSSVESANKDTENRNSNNNNNDNNNNNNNNDSDDGDSDDEADETTAGTPPGSIVISSSASDQQLASYEGARGNLADKTTTAGKFQVNELVNFTCHSMASRSPLVSTRIEWFINDQLIEHEKVNSVGPSGDKIVYDVEQDRAYRWQGVAETTTTSRKPRDWLLVEFTASLLQLKELQLRCRTVVEQPLIEYEVSSVLSLAASPFIQAAQDSSEQQLQATARTRPSLYNVRPAGGARQHSSTLNVGGHDYNAAGQNAATGQQQQRHRSNVIRMRQSQRQPGSSSPSPRPVAWLDWRLLLVAYAHLQMIGNRYSLQMSPTSLAIFCA